MAPVFLLLEFCNILAGLARFDFVPKVFEMIFECFLFVAHGCLRIAGNPPTIELARLR